MDFNFYILRLKHSIRALIKQKMIKQNQIAEVCKEQPSFISRIAEIKNDDEDSVPEIDPKSIRLQLIVGLAKLWETPLEEYLFYVVREKCHEELLESKKIKVDIEAGFHPYLKDISACLDLLTPEKRVKLVSTAFNPRKENTLEILDLIADIGSHPEVLKYIKGLIDVEKNKNKEKGILS